MIEVLEHGSTYKRLKEKCCSCNCVFTFDKYDIKYDYDLYKHYILCPECDNIIDVEL